MCAAALMGAFVLGICLPFGAWILVIRKRSQRAKGAAYGSPSRTVAAAGYDGEHMHGYARKERGVNSLNRAKIARPTDKQPSGFGRRRTDRYIKSLRYGQLWQVETVNSMLKQLMGSALRARSYYSQCREHCLRALAGIA